MYAIAIAVLVAQTPNELSAAARQDAQQFAADGKFSRYHYYLVADEVTNGVLRWVLSSTSLQPEIEQCLPTPIVPGLYRIYLGTPLNEEQTKFDGGLGWRHEDWFEVLKAHPYGGYGIMVRGDWLLTDILDAALSASQHEDGIPTYDRLLYRGKPPKTEAELLKFWEIDDVKQRHRGAIEGISQVNRRGRRWIETRDRHEGYFWITRDATALSVGSDPLEDPTGGFRHDGSEAIVGLSKVSTRSFERGSVQYYWLGNGAGTTVYEAPVQLVEDSTRFRNVPSIRTWGSCLQCHLEGIRPLDSNALVELHQKYGVLGASTNPALLADIRRFHFGSLTRDIERNQEDYAAGVRMHTGWTVKELVEAVKSVVEGYDASLTLAKASLELGVSPEILRERLIGYSGLSEGKFAFGAPAGLLVLVNGGTCSRDLFAQQFSFLDGLVRQGETNATTPRTGTVPVVKGPDRTGPSDTSADAVAEPTRRLPTGRPRVNRQRPRR